MLQTFLPFAVSLLIGLIIGIERERSHPPKVQAVGVRSFILFSLLGTLAAQVNQPALAIVIAAFVLAIIIFSYLRSTAKRTQYPDIGVTTELAAGTVFCLGYIALEQLLLAAILGTFVLAVLLARQRLHQFSRNELKAHEIQAAATLLLIAIAIIPFLPNHSIDPWQLFNPRRFGLLVLMIASLQFGGYVAIRAFGERLGMLLLGFFGGIVSSTAVFATLPGTVRQRPSLWRAAVVAGIFSTIGMLVEFSIIIFAAAPSLLATLIWPISAMILVGISAGLLMLHADGNHQLNLKRLNPLHIISVFRLSLFIGLMLILVAIAQKYTGSTGINVVTFLGGLFELHSVTLATAMYFHDGGLPLANIDIALALAILASFISKFVLLFILARNRFGVVTAGFLLLMLLAGGLTFLLL